MTDIITLSIETDDGTYQHGFHLGTDRKVARSIAQDAFHTWKPRQGTLIKSVALKQSNKQTVYYDGTWSSDF